jgi:hypothetical protein
MLASSPFSPAASSAALATAFKANRDISCSSLAADERSSVLSCLTRGSVAVHNSYNAGLGNDAGNLIPLAAHHCRDAGNLRPLGVHSDPSHQPCFPSSLPISSCLVASDNDEEPLGNGARALNVDAVGIEWAYCPGPPTDQPESVKYTAGGCPFSCCCLPVRRPCLVPPRVTGGLAMLLFVPAPREVLTKTWEPPWLYSGPKWLY